MEIPVLNRISDFEALHQSQSNFLISQSGLSISGIARISHAYTLWKWGAFLLLALLASFSGLLNFFVFTFRRLRPLPSQSLLHYQSDNDTDSDTDDEEDDEEEEEEEEDESGSDYSESDTDKEDDFGVGGSDEPWQSRKFRLRHRRSIGDLFSWGDLAPGKSVVKLWDNLGLGLEFQDDGNVFSLRDVNKEQEINYFLGDAPSSVEVSGNKVEVNVWDRRVSCRIPAMVAEWHTHSKKLFGDIRKPNEPLHSEVVQAWWDPHQDEDSSYMARCCDAVRSHFLLGREEQN